MTEEEGRQVMQRTLIILDRALTGQSSGWTELDMMIDELVIYICAGKHRVAVAEPEEPTPLPEWVRSLWRADD